MHFPPFGLVSVLFWGFLDSALLFKSNHTKGFVSSRGLFSEEAHACPLLGRKVIILAVGRELIGGIIGVQFFFKSQLACY